MRWLTTVAAQELSIIKRPVEVHNRHLIANDEGQVTVMFVDISSFNDLMNTHTPTDIVAILDA